MEKVLSNLTPRQVHYALMETFQHWVDFSLGVGKLGGKMLKAPSGQMASALRAEYNLEGNVVALYIDPKELGAIESKMIQGHKGFSLKRRMLYGNAKAKRSKDGYLYREIAEKYNIYKGHVGAICREIFWKHCISDKK